MRFRAVLRAGVPVLALSMMLVACGDDDDDASPDTTVAVTAGGDNEELCALAEEMNNQEDFPTAAQIEQYTELAPEETADAVAVAGPPIIAADGEAAAFFLAIADDDVEAALEEINAWETENCGIEHDIRSPEQTEIDPDATRVDVVALEHNPGYGFEFETELTAGPTSFVLTNPGAEVHFMVIAQIADGHTMEEALAFEGDPEEAGLLTGVEYDSGLAAPGGEDEEVITADLVPGNWAMLCFVSPPDGPPHAFSGMAVPFTVS